MFWLALALAGPASAQQAAPKAATPAAPAAPAAQAVSAEPSSTTASFGDWTLRCQRTGDAAKPGRICEVAQVLQAQGQQTPIAQIALGRLGAGEPLRVTAVMPVSVTFPSSVQIVMGDKDAKPLELAWRRCIPNGCFADTAPSDDVIRQWRKASEPGRILFKDAAGRELALPLSARGLDQAVEALAKERL
ncbi:MAG TPA: invasion associated locus B family protein [Bosea sp. (in: a-proteobacteria)]|uniref:invasion associated locus B family protein n=1 Tax=Bosea sp. (in: a-proteobacteria) TaxID=1871050 RepID=UPI002E11E9DD|nr:invasion associated locus B family protein [Bosea sp. (in: a-proteobacteria)]